MAYGTDKAALEAFIEEGYDEDDFDEAYQGYWNDLAEYGRELLVSSGEIKINSIADQYMDWEYFARDLEHDYWTAPAFSPNESGVFVFRKL
jgi:antirestriction protein